MSQSPNPQPETKNNSILNMLKPAVLAFSVLLLASMLFLKPYLPKVIYYNFAKLDDYKHFANRVVRSEKGQAWERDTASNVKLPDALSAKLDSLKTTALVAVKDGKIVFEKYDLDGGADVLSNAFSSSKGIVALLTGFALQEGKIKSLDEPIIQYLPELGERPEGKITLKNLLTMTSGTSWEESANNPFSITAEAYYGEDLYHTALKPRLIAEPGKVYVYKSGDTQLLGMAVSRAVKMTLANYASEKLWIPLQAEGEALWSLDHEDGLEKAYCCFNATARDFARIGQFVLQKGKWNGKQLLNEQYIQEMLTPHHIPNMKGEPVDYFGYQWRVLTEAPTLTYFTWGLMGQYFMVMPEKNMVVIRLGKKEGEMVKHAPEEVRMISEWASKL